MVLKQKYWLIIYGISLALFCFGFANWLMAHFYQPLNPTLAPVRHNDIGEIPSVYSLERYRSLLGGRLFFGGADIPDNPGIQIPQFTSRMVLWGVIKGGHAIVGFDSGSNQDTKLVKAGDVIEGEKILAIGDKYIEVRNQTGQGKIRLIGE